MTVDELKEWMNSRFDNLDERFDKLNDKVTTHDRWLWLLRGIGVVLIIVLGFIGVKIR